MAGTIESGSKSAEHPPRRRERIAVALAVVIGTGLASRSDHAAVPGWFATQAGDALWAAAVYLALALVMPAMRSLWLAVFTLLISLVVELSQLWQTAWLEDLRSTLPGRLLLGRGWQWEDLPRYVAGTVLAWCTDRTAMLTRGRDSALRRAAGPGG